MEWKKAQVLQIEKVSHLFLIFFCQHLLKFRNTEIETYGIGYLSWLTFGAKSSESHNIAEEDSGRFKQLRLNGTTSLQFSDN